MVLCERCKCFTFVLYYHETHLKQGKHLNGINGLFVQKGSAKIIIVFKNIYFGVLLLEWLHLVYPVCCFLMFIIIVCLSYEVMLGVPYLPYSTFLVKQFLNVWFVNVPLFLIQI